MTLPPPGLRDGNTHGKHRPCCVRLFQAGRKGNRSRQNGEGAGSGGCYAKIVLYGVRGHGKAVMPGSMTTFSVLDF